MIMSLPLVVRLIVYESACYASEHIIYRVENKPFFSIEEFWAAIKRAFDADV